MRAVILFLLIGQWTALYVIGWPEAKALFGPFVISLGLYLWAHFYFSPQVVWHEFRQACPRLFVCSALSCMVGFYQVTWLAKERMDRRLSTAMDGQVQRVQVVVEDLPRKTASAVQFNALLLSRQEVSWHTTEGNTQLAKTPKRLAIHWQLPNPKWSKKPFNEKTMPLPSIVPGQIWQFNVKLKVPRGLKNPYGFAVEEWMMMQGLDGSGFVVAGSAELLPQTYWSFSVVIAKLRWAIREKVLRSLGSEAAYAGVISALVMGDQQAISQEDWTVFNATGIGHLISISGLHVTMLAGFGATITRRIWQKTRLPLRYPAQKMAALMGFLCALLYTFLAGFQVPAQRTTCMVMVVGIYLFLARTPKPFDIWWWALACVAILDPWAIFTPGCCLSFGAVAAILYAMPTSVDQQHLDIDALFLEKLKSSLCEATRVQAVVTIALIPLSVWWFYQISLISPLANAVAIPIVSFLVTPLAMLGVILPWWFGDGCLWLAHAFFGITAWVLKPLASLSWSTMVAAKPNAWLLFVALFGVVIAIRPGELATTWRSRLVGLLFCFTLLVPKAWLFGNGVNQGEFRMLVWDIGQGSAVLVETKNHTLLYDTGPVSGSFDPGKRIILPYLRASGIGRVDLLALSHQDADHVGGLKAILQDFPIEKSLGTLPQDHPLHQTYIAQGVPIFPCQAGQSWVWDEVEFYVWHPHESTTFEKKFHTGKPNEMSCVIEVRNAHHSVWLTGDVEKEAERAIVERLHLQPKALKEILARNRVLMAPHHGSKTSSNPEFVELLDPMSAFSQSGYKNRYNHPHPSVIARYQARGITLLDTNQTGAQRWESEGVVLHQEFFRNSTE